jgi:hypothetical protein
VKSAGKLQPSGMGLLLVAQAVSHQRVGLSMKTERNGLNESLPIYIWISRGKPQSGLPLFWKRFEGKTT